MQYKIDQLKAMLQVEQGIFGQEQVGYGAHLQHWFGNSKPIQLDAEAIKALIRHYENRQKKEQNSAE